MKNRSTILIVDDEEFIRDALEGLLISQGHHLAFAGNGIEALAKAAELTPDLILLDVMMPGMDGFEVCRSLRADPHLAEVPIIMLTALDDRDSRLQGIEAGADDFLTKPFDSGELQLRVQTITRLNRYRRLLTERNKFEWVVEQAQDGYLMLDGRGFILYANPQARTFLGLVTDDQELPAEILLDLVKRQYHCEPEAAWESWPEAPAVQTPRYLVRPESATANSFWLQVDVIEMSSRNNERFLVRLHDITDNVMAQRVMWTFHDQVSHKLNTPLTKLASSIELLREDQSIYSEKEQQYFLETAEKGVIQLQKETKSIVKYLNSFRATSPDQTPCSLAEIPGIVAEIESNLELQAVNLQQDETLDRPDHIYIAVSRPAVELILWELFENAKKFHPEQAPALEMKIFGRSDKIYTQVKDDGLTLSPIQLAKIWAPYYQAEKFFTGQLPGMGLGLSMVAALVWSVGGTCKAYNREPGPGIVVELGLPIATNQTE